MGRQFLVVHPVDMGIADRFPYNRRLPPKPVLWNRRK